MTKRNRKPVQLLPESHNMLLKICDKERRDPGLQVMKLIEEEYERLFPNEKKESPYPRTKQ